MSVHLQNVVLKYNHVIVTSNFFFVFTECKSTFFLVVLRHYVNYILLCNINIQGKMRITTMFLRDKQTKIIKMKLISAMLLFLLAIIIMIFDLYEYHIYSYKPKYQYPFQDPSLPIDTRLDNLMSLLTTEEKVHFNCWNWF